MPNVKITKSVVDGAKPASLRYTIVDSVVPGFGLRVFPSGSKSWVFEYRPGEGGRGVSTKRLTIGKASDLSPDQARREADKLRAQVKTGSDPMGAKAAQRAAPTVAYVADKFLAVHLKKRSSQTKVYYEDIIERIIKPRAGTRKAKDWTVSEVASLHQDMEDTPYFANRVLAVISSMYAFASAPAAPVEAKVPAGCNPAKGIERFDEKQRGRVLNDHELLSLGTALRKAETEGLPWTINPEGQVKHVPKTDQRSVISPFAAAAIRLLILTGARLREILNLKWTDIDAQRGLLVIEKHKTARKTGTKYIVLNAPAIEVLESIPRIGIYVIAGANAGEKDEKPRHDLKRPWALVRAEAGLPDLRLHDLRHNFGGFGAGGGAGLLVIGALLGHSPSNPQTTARYAHLINDPLRRASNSIGNALMAAMGENNPKNETSEPKVVPLLERKSE